MCGLVAVCVLAPQAHADAGLFAGVADDRFKHGGASYAVAGDLGLEAVRVTLRWSPGQTTLAARDAVELDNVVAGAGAIRVVLAVYGARETPPLDDAARAQYCEYIRGALARYPTVNDVVLWNEPNLGFFWRPQFNSAGASAAPAAYAALAAHCWDVLHSFRPEVNIIGPATSSFGNDDPASSVHVAHSPGAFIRRVGDAYRASGRGRPIFDTIAHHVYPDHFAERPWRRHPFSKRIAQGDWYKLMDALLEAFEGTAQRIPGEAQGGRTVSIWYLEGGFETIPAAGKASAYTGTETSLRRPIPAYVASEPERPPVPDDSSAPDQATQLVDAIRLAYCQPNVKAWFNFLLQDERELESWQTGVLWADGTPKGSYASFRSVVHEAANDRVDCSQLKGGPLPQPPREVGGASGGAAGAAGEPLDPAQELSYLRDLPRRAALSGGVDPTRSSPRGASSKASPVRVLLIQWPKGRRIARKPFSLRLRIRVDTDARYRAVLRSTGRHPRRAVRRGTLEARVLSRVTFPRMRLRPGAYRIELRLTPSGSVAAGKRLVSPVLRLRDRASGR